MLELERTGLVFRVSCLGCRVWGFCPLGRGGWRLRMKDRSVGVAITSGGKRKVFEPGEVRSAGGKKGAAKTLEFSGVQQNRADERGEQAPFVERQTVFNRR